MINKNKKKDKQTKTDQLKSVLFPIIGSIVIILSAVTACIKVNEIATESCMNILESTTEQLARDINICFENAGTSMEVVAKMLSNYITINEETCQKYMNHLKRGKLIANYSVLLPNNANIYNEDTDIPYHTKYDFNFDDWKDKEATLSDKFLLNNGEYAVALNRQIVKDGEIVGILLGYIRLDELSDIFSVNVYDGNSEQYLSDGRNGDILMDTWHNELGNVYDLNLLKRPTKGSTTFVQMEQDAEKEKPGFVIFTSETTGEDFYTYYSPVGIYKLNCQITVPDRIVFENAIKINKILWIVTAIQVLLTCLYIIYAFRKIKNIKMQDKKDLIQTQAINKIQKRLLNVYKNPELFSEALELVAEVVGAENNGVCKLIVLDNGIITDMHAWPRYAEKNDDYLYGTYMPEEFSDIYNVLKSGNSAKYTHDDIMNLCKNKQIDVVGSKFVDNVVISPISNMDNSVVGFIYVTNSPDLDYTAEILERIARTLLIALNNYKSYLVMQNMGEFDSLTGLKNRNAFNRDIVLFQTEAKAAVDTFFSVYIDANDIHEINNKISHSYGDKMLRAIGKKIIEIFGNDYSYRVGGDEFIIFVQNTNIHEITEKTNKMREDLLNDDCHISVGIAVGNEANSIDELNIISETRMYEDKEQYYKSEENERRKRNIDDKLARIVNDKENQDAFLKVIQSHYLGVYLVNLDTDNTRCIFKPEYFEFILKKHNYKHHIHSIVLSIH